MATDSSQQKFGAASAARGGFLMLPTYHAWVVLDEMGFSGVLQKVAATVLSFQQKPQPDGVVEVYFSRDDLADITSVDLKTVDKTLKKMEQCGLHRLEKGHSSRASVYDVAAFIASFEQTLLAMEESGRLPYIYYKDMAGREKIPRPAEWYSAMAARLGRKNVSATKPRPASASQPAPSRGKGEFLRFLMKREPAFAKKVVEHIRGEIAAELGRQEWVSGWTAPYEDVNAIAYEWASATHPDAAEWHYEGFVHEMVMAVASRFRPDARDFAECRRHDDEPAGIRRVGPSM